MDDLYRKYLLTISTSEQGTAYYTDWVTPEMKDAFINRAKAGAKSHDPIEQDWYEEALIRLGDKAALQAHVEAFHKNPHRGLKDADSLLPYLIDDLYHGSKEMPDPYTVSIRDQVDATFLQILRRYPAFPLETRKWADARYDAGGGSIPGDPPTYWPDEVNLELRMWWEHNKSAVLAGDYGRATWLPSAAWEKKLVDADRKRDEQYEKSHPGLILWDSPKTSGVPKATGT
jgi:hypothetical protein